MPVLADDLNNYLIKFDQRVLVTNLLDEYGGMLEELAKTVSEFLAAEEANGKKFLKTFLLRGVENDSSNEVITVVSEEKLEQRKEQLRDAHTVLYSAESDGGSKSPPVTFAPLKHFAIKLDSLEMKDAPRQASNGTVPNGTAASVKEDKQPPKNTSTLGAMFQKQEAAAATSKKSPAKKLEPEKKTGALGAMFKKQESKKAQDTASPEFKSPETEKNTKSTQEKSKKPGPASKKGLSGFLTKKDEEKPKPSVLKPPTPKKVDDFFKKEVPKKPTEESAANVSVNLCEESSSSSDEEALDALKREVLTDDEDGKPSTSNKRRRIIDSDDEDTGPEVKVERKEPQEEPIDEDDESVKSSETFMDDDGFIVTVKAKNKRLAPATKTQPASAATTVNVKKESPKSPAKKEASSKIPAAKKKQGNIMSFFAKK